MYQTCWQITNWQVKSRVTSLNSKPSRSHENGRLECDSSQPLQFESTSLQCIDNFIKCSVMRRSVPLFTHLGQTSISLHSRHCLLQPIPHVTHQLSSCNIYGSLTPVNYSPTWCGILKLSAYSNVWIDPNNLLGHFSLQIMTDGITVVLYFSDRHVSLPTKDIY